MRIDVIPSVNEARAEDFINRTTIVIDVLRATSTICTALNYGSRGVITVETVSQAKEMRDHDQLLGGERYCKKITGFDLGNSPFEYMSDTLLHKTIVMTTTNGTRAINKAQKSPHLLAGCMLNAPSCARTAIHFKRDISILCAGTQDQFSLEDGICAGYIIDEIMQHHMEEQPTLNDFALAMRAAYLNGQEQIVETILNSCNGKKLSKIGLEDDVRFCAKMDHFSVVPVLNGSIMQPFEA